jgi:hypothetical protein
MGASAGQVPTTKVLIMPRFLRPVTPCAYSLDGAHKASGLSRKRITAAVKDGELRRYRVGVKKLILRVDLEAWIRSIGNERP